MGSREKVGKDVGDTVGCDNGEPVGEFVGSDARDSVGEPEGESVGEPVGESVIIGALVGVMVMAGSLLVGMFVLLKRVLGEGDGTPYSCCCSSRAWPNQNKSPDVINPPNNPKAIKRITAPSPFLLE